MDSKAITGQSTPSKLGFTATAKIGAPLTSGCGKSTDSMCGIRYKNG